MQKLLHWLDERTGYRHAVGDALYEHIPSGSRWRYVFGSTLVFAFVTQLITGLFLWMAYSPSSQSAWESVYYIHYHMQGGWLLRGVHHFMAQAMVVLLALHLMQVIIDGAYKAPREVNFWLGLILMQLVLGLSLTGYLLPWDQKGFWATQVATNLATLVPVFGASLQKLVVGGSEYGHHTLTRFFALHAGVLPLLLLLFLGLHLSLFRKHGVNAIVKRGRQDSYFWPDQVLKDAVACLAVLAIVFMLTIHFDFAALFNGTLSPDRHGAELGAPADPSEQYSAARPEWYFLFLFQLLKYFPGPLEIIGAIILPGVVFFLLFIMPFTGRTKSGHLFNVAFIFVVVAGSALLTFLALRDDYYGPNSEDHLAAVAEAHRNKERIVEIIQHQEEPDGPPQMIPRVGAVTLLRSDPKTQGPKLFERNCLSCHGHTTLDEQLAVDDANYWEDRDVSAPNLDGFASRQWIAGVLDPTQIRSPHYFGNTAHKQGRMAEWLDDFVPNTYLAIDDLKDTGQVDLAVLRLRLSGEEGAADKISDMAIQVHESGQRVATQFGDGQIAAAPVFAEAENADGEEGAQPQEPEVEAIHFAHLEPKLDDIAAALSAQAKLPYQVEADAQAAKDGRISRGLKIIKTTCANGCHRMGDAGQLGLAPDLTGYGSWQWMMGIVSDPSHRRFYGPENDRMPSFGKQQIPNDHEVSMIVDWLRKDYIDETTEFAGKSHTAEQAERGVELALTTASPQRSIVGETPPAEATAQRAERLFRQNCAACHSYTDEHGVGIPATSPSAPNLHGFASRKWIDGLLDPEKFNTAHYFGNTKFAYGQMADAVEGIDRDDDEFPKLVAALSMEAELPAQADIDQQSLEADGLDVDGRIEIVEVFACTDCHSFHGAGVEDAPDLTGYGSRRWIAEIVSNPEDDRFYGRTENDRMPAFAGHPGAAGRLLSDEEIELLARFIRREPLENQQDDSD